MKSHNKIATVFVLTVLLAIPTIASAQTTEPAERPAWPTRTTLGFGGGININSPSSDTYVVDSTQYTTGTTVYGLELHLLAEFPIGGNFMFAPRLSYNNLSTKWTGGTGVNAGINNTGKFNDLTTNYSTFGADLLFKYAFSCFHVMLGPSFQLPISTTYTHPTDIAGTTVNIPNSSRLVANIKVGVGYDIPLSSSHTIWLTPEVFYDYWLSNFATKITVPQTSQYAINTIQAGLSLKFDVGHDDTPIAAAMPLSATITARGVLPDNTPAPEPVVPQQATHTRSSLPLLPYVFFSDNSAEIPSRYSRMGATGFSPDALKGKDAFDANHALLDVVGSRMKQYPTTNVTLTGTNCNSGPERRNINLSKARAMAVKNYLVNTWGIDASRITVDQRDLPELATNPVTGAGKQENRRVEISSSDPRLTEPVKIESRDNVSVGETVIRFETTVKPSDQQFKDWTITLDQNGTPIGQPLSGTGNPPATTTMTISNAGSYLNQPVHYKMVANDVDGRQVTADGMTRIVNRTIDRENLEHYGMLSFDFNTADINPRAKEELDLISESISRDANGVTVTGYCDTTGSAEYNQALSEQRANSAIQALRASTTLPANSVSRGEGIRDPKFVNDLPEGRMLNRRVEIEIDKSSK